MCLDDDREIVERLQNDGNVQLKTLKHFRYEGSAQKLRFSPDNKWLLWKGAGNRPFMARIEASDTLIQEIKCDDGLTFWADVCFAGDRSDYFILAQISGQVDERYRTNLWKQPLDLKKPAQLIFFKPGDSSYPIEISSDGTQAFVPIEIRSGITGGYGLNSDAEAAALGGSQYFLIDLKTMKEVWAFPSDGKFARFHPTKPTVVVREGDRFSEFDFAGKPVAIGEPGEPQISPEAGTNLCA